MNASLFIYSVLASILGAAIYSIVFSRRETVVRLYLSKKRAGWRRRKYVRIFIQAIRGETKVVDSKNLIYLLMLYPLVIYLSGQLAVQTLNQSYVKLDGFQIRINNLTQGVEPEVTTLSDIELDIDDARRKLNILYPMSIGLCVLGGLWYLWMAILWQPYVMIRARFSHELDRFMLRIQGLASKAELSELFQLEANVVDEESARLYVGKISSIAQRHNVKHLVDTLLLWEE